MAKTTGTSEPWKQNRLKIFLMSTPLKTKDKIDNNNLIKSKTNQLTGMVFKRFLSWVYSEIRDKIVSHETF